jgi:formylglycine-generating enzyme required for sulfatase activity
VIYVSWDDAKEYVRWLGRRTGHEHRLPSEAEWEAAARARSETRYWWGDEVGQDKANCDGCGNRWDNTQTAPVGSFAANPFGLFDVHGNVCEWVEDCWHDSYGGALVDGSAWTGGGCGVRVLRSGSWMNYPRGVGSTNRDWLLIVHRLTYVGFRVARTLF